MMKMKRNTTMGNKWIVILLATFTWTTTFAEPCDIETGQSNVIVDIEESLNDQISQSTRPKFLPIEGDVGQILLEMANAGRPAVFGLDGKQLRLLEPLDRDHNDISSVVLQVSCTNLETGRKRNIPVIVRISDVNDNAPVFPAAEHSQLRVTIPEDMTVGAVIPIDIEAKDADAGINSLVEYKVVPSARNNSLLMPLPGEVGTEAAGPLDEATADGFGVFEFASSHKAVVTLRRSLDYETVRRYLVTIVASDRALNVKDRLSSTVTLTVDIKDVNDQPPAFQYTGCPINSRGVCITPTYTASIMSGVSAGLLSILPERIQAIDTDSSRALIRYSFDDGTPANFRDYFEIHPNTGWVRQLRPVNRSEISKFDLLVKAEEVTDKKKFSNAVLKIEVVSVGKLTPRLVADSPEGFVEENSAVGTPVISTKRRQPLQLKVIGDDDEEEVLGLARSSSGSNYEIELTSSAFRVNEDGILEVATPDLDRDPPNPSTLTFQAIARKTDGTATPPLAISIRLMDVNDHAPRFASLRPVLFPAGEAQRFLARVAAEDRDFGDFGKLEYRITDVTNNGKSKFIINPQTGDVDAVGALRQGEKYIIAVQATDGGGKSAEGRLEVVVIPGPNLRPPIFSKDLFEFSISEGAPVGSAVFNFLARDPEGEEVAHTIVAGNELGHFSIDKKNGTLIIASPLDREELSRYSLTIKAQDSGALSSTARASIRVLDVNDRVPEFIDLPYVFSVRENDITGYVGRVRATDADLDRNGQITYSVPADSFFVINSQTGEIKSKIPLDYEKEKVHRIVVTARDGGDEPRTATATATVMVLDLSDEAPKFSQSKYVADVPENSIDFFVAHVQATDKDSQTSITYTIRQGDIDKFTIDPQTGVVRTRKFLDYERQLQYILIVGTVENTDLNDPQSTTTLVVNVLDRNDMAPIYTSVPRPVRLQSTAPIGQVISTVSAVDADGTAPNNQIRYEMLSSTTNKAVHFFRVDPETGVISVKDNLRKNTDREYKLEIRAYDLGKPPMSTLASVMVYVDHVAPLLPPDLTHVSFSEGVYSVSVAEDALVNTLVKNLSIINKPNEVVPISCEIVSGNDNEMFYVKTVLERNCELRLKRELDYETVKNYEIVIRLKSSANLMVEEKTTARVAVSVMDINDNGPKFVFKYPENRFSKGKYYAGVPYDAPISSLLVQVTAEDADSGALGQVVYEIMEETNVGKHFTIERATGTIRTDKMMNSLRQLPVRLIVTARDNPGQEIGYHETNCQVVVNVVGKQHRLVLVMPGTPPDHAHRSQSAIVGVLQDETRLIIRVEKVQALTHVALNGSLHQDPSGSEFWFYCIDPSTETILTTNHSIINSSMLDTGSVKHLIDTISSKLKLDVTEIRPPLALATSQASAGGPIRTSRIWDGFPAALVVVAVLVFLLALGGIVYICVTWEKFQRNKRERLQPYVVFPTYNPVVVDPSPKEYETQILQLSVTNSTDGSENSSGDLNMDFHPRRNHSFPLAVPGYMPGHKGIGGSAASSDIATLRISSLAGSGNCEFSPAQFFPEEQEESPIPTANPLYEGSDEDPLNYTSATNTNVTFRSKLARLGIAEVSTEL